MAKTKGSKIQVFFEKKVFFPKGKIFVKISPLRLSLQMILLITLSSYSLIMVSPMKANESGLNGNPVMTFTIKKRINTELFIENTAALYMVDGRIKDEHVVRVVNHWYRLIQVYNVPKDAGM